jgi:acetyl-CoA carboxylase biotin carboxylase subunit
VKSIKKILVANRGEIALRVMRTAKRMGIATVAVYSEADRTAPHVLFADEAICLGPPPSSESYLLMDKIIKAAKSTGADAIHPGYGFLSENATFAEKLASAGLTFIGPGTHAINVMGSKLAAKDAVKDYEIPMVPGTDEAITDVKEAKKIAQGIGFPILVKASAGGGGKGMRIVEKVEEFEEQMDRAISEAISSFGDGSVFIEKYVTSPRHIEIQVLADSHGNTLHLFERECSIQRRHQKVVEEAPSAVLTPQLRKEMGEAAVRVAQACGYEGAGTVEFLLEDNTKFYFLEMNTRLQVEHPVTEMITGIDLVEQQIRVARGEELSFTQEDLKIKGHAFELRVYAENPLENFLPSTGTLETYKRPEGEGIRVDDGFREGMEIPIYYDPMIAKLITYGATRAEALQKMREAIAAYHISGVETTLPFGEFVFNNEAFAKGEIDTHFVKKYYTPENINNSNAVEKEIAAKVGLQIYLNNRNKLKTIKRPQSEWASRT